MTFSEIPFSDLLLKIIDNRGKTCPTSENGLPLIATNCIKNDSLYPTLEKVRYVSKETYNTWFRGHPEPEDMIFVTKGSPGNVCWVPDPVNFCIAQDMVAIRADEKKVYPKFLFALLRSQTTQMKISNMHVGTLIPHFKKGDFNKLLLTIPIDFTLQKKIGDYYFNISDKITLNTTMNQTLEAIAQTIFKSWFVDFEPFKEGKFIESEMGMIPEGWEVKDIGNEVETLGGGTPSTSNSEYWENGTINWFSPTDLTKGNSVFYHQSSKKINALGLANSSAKLFPAYSLMMTSRATIGEIGINIEESSTNQGFITLIPTKKLPLEYLYFWLIAQLPEVHSLASGSTFKEISKSNFRKFKVILPIEPIMKKFITAVKPIFEQIRQNQQQIQTLTTLRDTLLPKLMSGEVRV